MRITTATVQTVAPTASGATEIVLSPAHALTHRASQAALLIVPGGGAKPFTLSSDARAATLSIATSLASGSRFKSALGRLQPGDRVTVAGAFGGLPARDAATEQVLVAQGIGITPYLSLVRSGVALHASLLQVGAPHFFDEVAAGVTDAAHLAHRGDLTDAIARELHARPDAAWSVSGRGDFVASVAAQLRAAGVPSRRIHRDTFFGLHRVAVPAAATPVAVA